MQNRQPYPNIHGLPSCSQNCLRNPKDTSIDVEMEKPLLSRFGLRVLCCDIVSCKHWRLNQLLALSEDFHKRRTIPDSDPLCLASRVQHDKEKPWLACLLKRVPPCERKGCPDRAQKQATRRSFRCLGPKFQP